MKDWGKFVIVVGEKVYPRKMEKIAEITRDHRLEEDLGYDSLDKVELAMDLEQHFRCVLPPDADGVNTVGEAFDWFNENRLPRK